MKIQPNDLLELGALRAISGESVNVPDGEVLVHLQLRRFAGCPVCALHLRSVVQRHDELAGAGIREVVVFHSPAEELRIYAGDLPFAVIADPKKKLYAKLGAEVGVRALLDPRAWLPILWAVLSTSWAIVWKREASPPTSPHGGRFGLPADFLVARDGRVLAVKYGTHVYDQWSVDELLELTSSHTRLSDAPPRSLQHVRR
jgi:hypothetical protein